MDKKFVDSSQHSQTNHQTNTRSLWDRIWKDKHGHIVIGQMPNIWLIIWLILEIISLYAASHRVEEVTWWLASAALGIWALLEIFKGANYFRRALGFCVAGMTLMTVLGIGL